MVRLRLVDRSGVITLIACDVDGNRLPAGSLLFLTRDGRISRGVSVNSDFGFNLDSAGRIRLDEGER